MRRIKERLRLRFDKAMSYRAIARSCQVSHSSVIDLVRRAEKAGVGWPLPEDTDDAALEALLYEQDESTSKGRPEPDMAWIHRELRQSRSKNVTLKLLWTEYKSVHPNGLEYSQFCERYRQWRQALDLPMRQVHRAGEKMFVDFAGETVPVIDRTTGEVHEAQIVVASLGASNYTYVEACESQSLPCWIHAHTRAYAYFGGVPAATVPDNLKSGVKHASYYEPDVNPTYLEMAQYYGTVIIPTRPRKHRDKAKVENAVLQVERWILAPMRHRQFFSFTELRKALSEQLEAFNDRPFQKLEGSRRTHYEELDKPALGALPKTPYTYAEWRTATVNIDYHIELDHAYYSVPYQFVALREKVDVRLTATLVEILYKGRRIASHRRQTHKGARSTEPSHMPSAHRSHAEWSPSRLINWGHKVGPKTGALVKAILEAKPHPEQGYRSCLGLMRLGRRYTPERLEAACSRALKVGAIAYKSVESILERGLDQVPLEEPQGRLPFNHENIRGAHYYRASKGDSS